MTKPRAIARLIVAQISALTVWFASSAVIAEMAAEAGLAPGELAPLATAVQIGFALGALGVAVLGLADRYDPRTVFCAAALIAAAANASLLLLPLGGTGAILARALTGAALAGVYPVGMAIAVGWGREDRGLLVGLLVGALTLGTAAPHLIALGPGPDWRATILASSALAALGGLLVRGVALGPHHAPAQAFDPGAIRLAWQHPALRHAITAYLGHMWELYALWAWVGVVAGVGLAEDGRPDPDAAKITAFAAIALGGLACAPAGWLADRLGRARVALWCLAASGGLCLASAIAFATAPAALGVLLVLWGVAAIPDSALYSTLVADAAPPDRVGSLLTLQTALGFALTALSVQLLPALADLAGWPLALATLAAGPLIGARALGRLRALSPPAAT